MFGYIVPNQSLLEEGERKRFRSAYCGLCRVLRQKYGAIGGLTLSYDLTFLAMLLNALYEPEETEGQERCCLHPAKQYAFITTKYTEYAADMNVLLAYHKRMDDWMDDHNLTARGQASLLKSAFAQISGRYPEQSEAITEWLKAIHVIEQCSDRCLDLPVNQTGQMFGRLFAVHDDFWQTDLKQIGDGLGRFIYLMDAYDDLSQDIRHNRFNPLKPYRDDANFEEMCLDAMKMAVADSAAAFERLPILKDAKILRNILYSGVWNRYAAIQAKRKEKNKGAK